MTISVPTSGSTATSTWAADVATTVNSIDSRVTATEGAIDTHETRLDDIENITDNLDAGWVTTSSAFEPDGEAGISVASSCTYRVIHGMAEGWIDWEATGSNSPGPNGTNCMLTLTQSLPRQYGNASIIGSWRANVVGGSWKTGLLRYRSGSPLQMWMIDNTGEILELDGSLVIAGYSIYAEFRYPTSAADT